MLVVLYPLHWNKVAEVSHNHQLSRYLLELNNFRPSLTFIWIRSFWKAKKVRKPTEIFSCFSENLFGGECGAITRVRHHSRLLRMHGVNNVSHTHCWCKHCQYSMVSWSAECFIELAITPQEESEFLYQLHHADARISSIPLRLSLKRNFYYRNVFRGQSCSSLEYFEVLQDESWSQTFSILSACGEALSYFSPRSK